jgi:hypothetical protein
MLMISNGYQKLAVKVILWVQNLVPEERSQMGGVTGHMENKLNITVSYMNWLLLIVFGKSFACYVGQDSKLFPPKKKTNL